LEKRGTPLRSPKGRRIVRRGLEIRRSIGGKSEAVRMLSREEHVEGGNSPTVKVASPEKLGGVRKRTRERAPSHYCSVKKFREVHREDAIARDGAKIVLPGGERSPPERRQKEQEFLRIGSLSKRKKRIRSNAKKGVLNACCAAKREESLFGSPGKRDDRLQENARRGSTTHMLCFAKGKFLQL